MPKERDLQKLQDLKAALWEELTRRLEPSLTQDPKFAEVLANQIDTRIQAVLDVYEAEAPPADSGLSALIGIGSNVATDVGDVSTVTGIKSYDETINAQRIQAIADLYYIYQHERVGVFRVVAKLKELFDAGTVRLSNGDGALRLYRFDRRDVLRYTRRERLAAYRRAFGYGNAPLPPGSRPNMEFHDLFTFFINEVVQYWRDKRISDVIRERAQDPSFGSVATVRRAGFDLRNNLKWASYGNLNILRTEVMQTLNEAFNILNANDVKQLFGADSGWDVLEEVLTRYFNEPLNTSPRQRMAEAGREILQWIAEPYILAQRQAQFEAKLRPIAGSAEEWITSAQAMGLAERRLSSRAAPWDGPPPVAPVPARRSAAPAANGQLRQQEFEDLQYDPR